MKRIDPLLRTQPWRVMAVFTPVERMLDRMEIDGTVETNGDQVVFMEHGNGEWFDLPAALNGLVEFHELATEKHGVPASTAALTKLASDLHDGNPIFEADIAAVRRDIASCKHQALKLRISQAADIVRTIQIRSEIAMNDVLSELLPAGD